jgi:hypothetical protein
MLNKHLKVNNKGDKIQVSKTNTVKP